MDISTAYPGKFLKSADLKGKSHRLTISHCQMEDMGGGDEQKPVIYFEGKNQGFVLNKTNSRIVWNMHGKHTEEWCGKEIEIYVGRTSMNGRPCDGIMVREEASQQQPPPAAPDVGDDSDEDVPF